jgi:hypothetical protein
MPAPKGHPLWGNPIKPKKYQADQLWEKALEYFKWCDDNPLMLCEQTKTPMKIPAGFTGEISEFKNQLTEIPHRRPYTIEALCLYLNISRACFEDYSKSKDETYIYICTCIREIINGQHLEGGMAGLFNPHIVSRKLGLLEKQEITARLSVPTIDFSKLTPEEAKTYLELKRKAKPDEV